MMRLTRRQAVLPGSLSTIPEAITVRSRSDGDPALADKARVAVSSLYDERGEEFFHYAMGLGRDAELARDAVQEAFMRYFVTLYRGNQVTTPRAWVYRVLHNYVLDRLKQRRGRDEKPLHDAVICQQPVDIEADCIQKEILQQVRQTLTSREYDCFCLRSEGLRYEEIAAELQLTSGAVGTLLCRAVRKLRSVFKRSSGGDK